MNGQRGPAAILAFGLLLAPPTGAAQTITPTSFTLKNGLKVVLVEDHTVPSICFALAFRVGSRNERPGITGISHLFEHMMFNGSKKYPPGEFDRILESGGGYSNAYTSTDITFYYEEFNPDLLDRVLDMEADRLRSLKIDSANLEQERGIVKEERRVSTDNDVRGRMIEELYAGAFVAHPYQNPVVGWMKDLDNITVTDAREYFRTYYAPNNATAIVVGDFDAKTLRPKIEKIFGAIAAQPAPRRVIDAEPPQLGERRVKLHLPAELPAVAIAYRAAAAAAGDLPALNLLAAILSAGQSSRLYQRLVYDLQIATEAAAGVDEFIDPGLFTFYAQMKPGEEVEEAEKEIGKILRAIAEDGVTEEELRKAKNAVRVAEVNEFKTNAGVANRLGYYEVIHGGFAASFSAAERYAAVTAEDIRRVAAEYLGDRRRTVVELVPESTGGANE
jgi:predicted Zn-dependent peptidase